MPFLNPVTLTHVEGKDLWIVAAPFTYRSARLGLDITVPQGSTTDLASIPEVLWNVIANDDPHIVEPATLHDYLYAVGGVLPDGTRLQRMQCDQTLRDAMADCGAPDWKMDAVYNGVRAFGGSHWPADMAVGAVVK
jgi:hypothetical protein